MNWKDVEGTGCDLTQGAIKWLAWRNCEKSQKPMSIIVQQDATIYSLLYFCKLLYMFRLVTPPIIRINITVITASGTGQPAFATFHCRGAVGTAVARPTAPRQQKVAKAVWPVPDAVIIVICAPDDGWSYHPKHVERAVYRNIINCI